MKFESQYYNWFQTTIIEWTSTITDDTRVGQFVYMYYIAQVCTCMYIFNSPHSLWNEIDTLSNSPRFPIIKFGEWGCQKQIIMYDISCHLPAQAEVIK